MLVVNLFGAPGAGKSTGAAYVFAKLKMEGVNAELVTEFAKDKVWEGNDTAFENQSYIFGEQFFRMSRLKDKVDVVVTDSPLLLGAFYDSDEFSEELDALVTKVFRSFDSMNVFIDRVKPYNPVGRLQNEEESDAVAIQLAEYLTRHGVVCRHYNGDIQGYDVMVRDILRWRESHDQA